MADAYRDKLMERDLEVKRRIKRQAEINETIDLLKALWFSFPECRLMQLLCNLLPDGDPFHVTEEELLSRMRNYFRQAERFNLAKESKESFVRNRRKDAEVPEDIKR